MVCGGLVAVMVLLDAGRVTDPEHPSVFVAAGNGTDPRSWNMVLRQDGVAAVVVSFWAAVLTKIYLCKVCSCQELANATAPGQHADVPEARRPLRAPPPLRELLAEGGHARHEVPALPSLPRCPGRRWTFRSDEPNHAPSVADKCVEGGGHRTQDHTTRTTRVIEGRVFSRGFPQAKHVDVPVRIHDVPYRY